MSVRDRPVPLNVPSLVPPPAPSDGPEIDETVDRPLSLSRKDSQSSHAAAPSSSAPPPPPEWPSEDKRRCSEVDPEEPELRKIELLPSEEAHNFLRFFSLMVRPGVQVQLLSMACLFILGLVYFRGDIARARATDGLSFVDDAFSGNKETVNADDNIMGTTEASVSAVDALDSASVFVSSVVMSLPSALAIGFVVTQVYDMFDWEGEEDSRSKESRAMRGRDNAVVGYLGVFLGALNIIFGSWALLAENMRSFAVVSSFWVRMLAWSVHGLSILAMCFAGELFLRARGIVICGLCMLATCAGVSIYVGEVLLYNLGSRPVAEKILLRLALFPVRCLVVKLVFSVVLQLRHRALFVRPLHIWAMPALFAVAFGERAVQVNSSSTECLFMELMSWLLNWLTLLSFQYGRSEIDSLLFGLWRLLNGWSSTTIEIYRPEGERGDEEVVMPTIGLMPAPTLVLAYLLLDIMVSQVIGSMYALMTFGMFEITLDSGNSTFYPGPLWLNSVICIFGTLLFHIAVSLRLAYKTVPVSSFADGDAVGLSAEDPYFLGKDRLKEIWRLGRAEVVTSFLLASLGTFGVWVMPVLTRHLCPVTADPSDATTLFIRSCAS